jgi:hypothetical protein
MPTTTGTRTLDGRVRDAMLRTSGSPPGVGVDSLEARRSALQGERRAAMRALADVVAADRRVRRPGFEPVLAAFHRCVRALEGLADH